MIKRPSTSEILQMFSEDVAKSEAMSSEVSSIRQDISNKLTLLNAQYEYALDSLMGLKWRAQGDDGKIVLAEVEKYGRYDSFGMTVHPKFAKTPRNLFNFRTTRGYLFKGNVRVTVNGLDNPHLAEALKEDAVEGKGYYIDEFEEEVLNITITPNLKTPLGSLKCNVLEIMPFLPGSFNIEQVKFYSRDNLVSPAHVIAGGIRNAGSQRIILDSKVDVGKVEMQVHLIYTNSKGLHPFGLRHLYFLEANFLDNSFIIVRADKKDDIAYIYDRVAIRNQFGSSVDESSREQGIEYYGAYDGKMLSRVMRVSTETKPVFVSSNVKTVYIRIPVKTSIISFTPTILSEKESPA